MKPKNRPDMRALLVAVLKTDDDLEAFAGDYFPEVSRRWNKGMTPVAKVNLLLDLCTLDELWMAINNYSFSGVERYVSRSDPPSPEGPVTPMPSSLSGPRKIPRTPVSVDLEYKRVVRTGLIEWIIDNPLRYRRLATLLEVYSGGGKTLAKQIGERYKQNHPGPVLWLSDVAHESASIPDCYALLTGDMTVHSQPEFDAWLKAHAGTTGALIILIVKRAPERFFEEVAAVLSGFRSANQESALIVVGGARILNMRRDANYWWSKLIAPSSYVDVSDLTELEVAELLVRNNLPVLWAPFFYDATGGHPALLYELVRRKISAPEAAHNAVRNAIRASKRLDRHLVDSQARAVLCRLREGKPVNQLSNSLVKHEPTLYAESRMYFDGLLHVGKMGETSLRCLSIKQILNISLNETEPK